MAHEMEAEGTISGDRKKVLELSGVGQIIGLKTKKGGRGLSIEGKPPWILGIHFRMRHGTPLPLGCIATWKRAVIPRSTEEA